MRLHEMTEPDLTVIRHQNIEVGFDLVRVGLSGESHALSQPSHMPIDPDCRLPECIPPQDIRGLSSNPRQRD
jgi:hypothetical protein